MRPANIITAWADIMCGFAATNLVFFWDATSPSHFKIDNISTLLWLILATTGLYGGGVVFNDVFDTELDKIERPERPIPSGRASYSGAILLGLGLLLLGILAAFMCNTVSGILAIAIAFAALIYDKWGKHMDLVGPLNMGLCRGLNLLLGMSAVIGVIQNHWQLALVPIIFIAAITMISRSEVKGGDKKVLIKGGIFFFIVFAFIISLGFYSNHQTLYSLPFLALFAFMIYKPLFRAYQKPTPANIKASVRGGIMGLIPMDAAIAAGYAGWVYGLLILLLLPLSIFLARRFAVT